MMKRLPVPLLIAAFALLVLPSLLTVFGERLAAHTFSGRHDPSAQDEAQAAGRWYRIATVVMRRPALWALSAVMILPSGEVAATMKSKLQ